MDAIMPGQVLNPTGILSKSNPCFLRIARARAPLCLFGYPPERIDAHQAVADEYFGEFANGSLPGTAASAKSSKTRVQPTKHTQRDAVPHPDQQISKLRKVLNLSDEQVGNIKPIIDAREAKVMEVTKDRSLAAEVRRLAINDLISESKSKMQAFLTDEQKTVLVEREQVHNAGKKA